METINNKIPFKLHAFFRNLKAYLDTTLYYFGSVQRFDYIYGKSDIDVLFFTDNEDSTILKLCALLNVKQSDIKKFVWIIDGENFHGHKLKYVHVETNTIIELEFFQEKFKKTILREHIAKINQLPYYVLVLSYIMKWLFYQVGAISSGTFITLKNYLYSTLSGFPEDKFLVLPNHIPFYAQDD